MISDAVALRAGIELADAPRSDRSAQWQPLKPKLVVEVRYEHFSGYRFRHGTKFLRWRPDKSPRQCTMDQVVQRKANLAKLLI